MSEADDIMDYESYVLVQNRALLRKVKRGALCAMVILSILFAACQAVSPSTIGADTRAGLDELSGQQTESAITAEQLIASTGAVSDGIGRIGEKAPDSLKPDLLSLSGKSAASEKLAVTLKGQLANERKTTAALRESAGKDSVETAKIAAEKDRAEKAELKAKNERNIAWAACAIVGLVLAGSVYLRIRRFWKVRV